MSITVTIGGTAVAVLEQSPSTHETADGRSVATFTVKDLTGLLDFQFGQPVVLTDTVGSYTFTGYVNDTAKTNLTPNIGNLIVVNCIDGHYIPDKLLYSGVEYQNRYAGDIVTDLVANGLAGEGLTASYAARNDQSQASWSAGVFTNTSATNNVSGGDLELAAAGTDINYSEGGTGGFSGNALKITGYVESGFATAVIYRKVWSGSQVVVSGDSLQYDVWIPSSNPIVAASMDMAFSDGTFFSANAGAGTDGQGLGPQPSNDLSGLASDLWYSRNHGVTGTVIGKTITGIYVTLYGTQQGNYTAYFRRIIWQNSGTTKITIFADNTTAPNVDIQSQNTGFLSPVLSVANTAAKSGFAITTINLTSVAIVKSSFIAWQSLTLGAAALATGTILIESSIDGGLSWMPCTNGSTIPQLVPGMSTSGISLQIRKTMTQGKNPDAMNIVSGLQAIVRSSYNATKTDVVNTFSSSNFSAGTNSNTVTNGSNLTLIGNIVPFAGIGDYVGVTTQFGINSGIFIYRQKIAFNNSLVGASLLRLDAVGNTWQNFTAEIDVYVPSNAGDSTGLVFRTTNFGSGSSAFSYYAGVSTGAVVLQKGTNTTGGSAITTLVTTTVSLTANSIHRLKIVTSGTSITIYLDDISMIATTDASFNIAGYFALRLSNSTGAALQTYYANFGVTPALTGTWTSAAFSIAGAGNYGNSIITWDTAQTPNTTSIEVDISYDNGSTWHVCTNGAAVPVLTSNLSLSTYTAVQVRAILTSNNASAFPSLDGIYVSIQGYYSASGNRVSPMLPLAPVGRAGSTVVAWSGIQPTNTVIAIDTSLDAITWSQVGTGASSSAQITGVTTQSEPLIDDFTTNDSLVYTSFFQTGGGLATWTWDTANSRLTVSGGTNAVLLYNSSTVAADLDISAVMDLSDGGGLCWRYQNQSNFYDLAVHDASSGSHASTVRLFKVVAGTRTQIGTDTAITFTRGTPHIVRINVLGTAINVYFDGVNVLSTTDSAYTGAGFCGLRNNGNTAQIYLFRLQFYGDDVTSKNVYSRVRLTSTDPTITPQITQLSVSCRNANIQNGAYIPQTNYSILNGNKMTDAQILGDLAKQSNFWQRIIANQVYFQAHQATLAPFAIYRKDALVANAEIDNINDAYRNSQWINGGMDTITLTQSFIGDGTRTNFDLTFPVDSIGSVTLNSVAQTTGVKGVDTGRQWYYKQAQVGISQDTNSVPINNTQTLTVVYNGQVSITVHLKNDAEIARIAALDGTTGIIEEAENGSGLNKAAIISKANGLLLQFAVSSKTLKFTTMRAGLAVGQLISVFVSPLGISDGTFLITDISTVWQTTVQNGVKVLQPFYSVTGVSGPVLGDWTRFIANLARLV